MDPLEIRDRIIREVRDSPAELLTEILLAVLEIKRLGDKSQPPDIPPGRCIQ